MRRPIRFSCWQGLLVVCIVLQFSADANPQSLPNLIAEWSNGPITALTPLPYQRWCEMHLRVKNVGRGSFRRNFTVTFRPTVNKERAFWQYGSISSPFRGKIDECSADANGVTCSLTPIAPGDFTGLDFAVRPMQAGITILDVRVDTENTVSESHEANTFISATQVKTIRSGDHVACSLQ